MPFTRSKEELLQGKDLSEEDICVRGTLVNGLTIKDIRLLDFFEGTVSITTKHHVDAHLMSLGGTGVQ